MKKIVVDVVADNDVVEDVLAYLVAAFISDGVTSVHREDVAATVTVSDMDVKYGCHCDIEPGEKPDECVVGTQDSWKCIYGLKRKEDCKYWRPVKSAAHRNGDSPDSDYE